MKRLRSSSPVPLPLARTYTASLTYGALRKHHQNTQGSPPMAPENIHRDPADIPIFPPSARPSQQPRSSGPSGPISDAQYRGCHLRRANIFVDHEVTEDVTGYADKEIFLGLMSDFGVRQDYKRFSRTARELVKRPSGETDWMNVLYATIYELSWERIEFVCNRGKLVTILHLPLPYGHH